MRRDVSRLLAAGAVGAALLSMAMTPPPSTTAVPEYRNPAAPIERRVADLLARMTLEEKAAQVHSAPWEVDLVHDPRHPSHVGSARTNARPCSETA
jgi:hypothetical protein